MQMNIKQKITESSGACILASFLIHSIAFSENRPNFNILSLKCNYCAPGILSENIAICSYAEGFFIVGAMKFALLISAKS